MSGNGFPPGAVTSDEPTARVKVAFPPELFDGFKAITVQPFTEVNSKLGRQYQASFFQPALAAGSSADIVIIVGSSPMVFKDIQVSFDSTLVSAQIFRGPTYSGGSPINIYNMNDEQAVAPVASLLGGVTTTATGTAVGPEIYSLGGEGIGNRTIGSVFQGSGVERILWPGETYLYRITNKDATLPSRITGVATWYQGPLSVNVGLEE